MDQIVKDSKTLRKELLEDFPKDSHALDIDLMPMKATWLSKPNGKDTGSIVL